MSYRALRNRSITIQAIDAAIKGGWGIPVFDFRRQAFDFARRYIRRIGNDQVKSPRYAVKPGR